jgi:uncharacterized protein (TIGR02271 family)
MPTLNDIQTWQGREVLGRDGEKIGTVTDVYLDRETNEPEWLTVKTGLFGARTSFVPISGVSDAGGELRAEYDKHLVKDAPNVDADGQLSPDEERALYEHYGRGQDYRPFEGRDDAGRFEGREPVGHDTSGPTTDDAMTRSEEELHVGVERQEAGRARLRKYIVTENVQKTVPVQREEVRIEREPITEGNAAQAYDGPALSEEEHEVTLHTERPVVEKEVVPKERVRLEKETYTEEQTVDAELRKEEIEAEGDGRTL